MSLTDKRLVLIMRPAATLANSAASTSETDAGSDAIKYISPSVLRTAVSRLRNALAPRQGLTFTGWNQAAITVPAFGTGDFTLVFWVRPNNFTNPQYLIGPNVANGFYCGIRNATGAIFSGKGGAAPFADTAMALDVGKTSCLVRVKTGGAFRWYLNGVVKDTGVDTDNYSVACTTLGGSGASYLDGWLLPTIYNRGLSAAEVLALFENGDPEPLDYGNTSDYPSRSYVSGSDSTFAADTGFWAKSNVTIAGGLATFAPGVVSYINFNSIVPSVGRYRITVTFDATSVGTLWHTNFASGDTQLGSAGTVVTEVNYVNPGIGFYIWNNTAGTTIKVDTITIERIGLLMGPQVDAPGHGLVWGDQSGNGSDILLPLAGGILWSFPSTLPTRIRRRTNTNGNQQFYGAAATISFAQILRVRARSLTGTPTVTLGTASGGSQLVAAVALSTSWKTLTLATNDPLGSSGIWAGSNSTDIVEWDITIEPVAGSR